jgi:hypothetical protein
MPRSASLAARSEGVIGSEHCHARVREQRLAHEIL